MYCICKLIIQSHMLSSRFTFILNVWTHQGRLDAASTNTRSLDLASPSIWTRSSVFILRLPSCSELYTHIHTYTHAHTHTHTHTHTQTLKVYARQKQVKGESEAETYPGAPARCPIIDSSSSMNMVDGAWNRASSNKTCKCGNNNAYLYSTLYPRLGGHN